MADEPKFMAVLQAVDRVTGPIDGIMGRLKGLKSEIRSEFTNPWVLGTEQAAKASGLARIHQQLSTVGRHMHGMGALAVAALGEESKEAAEHVEKLGGHLKATGKEAHGAAEQVKKSAHPHVYDVLSGHVHILRTRFGNLNAGVGEVGHSLSELLPMLGGLGAVASIGGLAEMMEHVIESQSQLANTAKAIGVTTHQLMGLNLAAEHADVPVQQMQLAMERLNAVVGEAKSGASKQVAALFHHMGIALKDAHGQAVPIAKLLPKLMDAFKHTHDWAMANRMAMALFGRAGMELLPFLDEGSEAWRRYNEESSKVDYDPTEKEREGLEKFHSLWIDLRHAVESVQVAIGSKLAPVLLPVVDQFKVWVANNREWLAQKVVDAVKGLADALKKMDIGRIVGDFGRLAKYAVDLGGAIGPMPMTIGALTLALGSPLLHAIVGAIRDLKELTTWAVQAATAIGTTLVKAVKAAGTAIKGLDATFHATTIGRAAALAFELSDMATGKHLLNLNATQKKLVDSWHLKAGQSPTGTQMAQLRALGPARVDLAPHETGPSFDQRARASLSHLLGWRSAKDEQRLYDRETKPTRLIVDFRNAPPGMRVQTRAEGRSAVPEVSVGYSNPVFGY